MGYSIGANFLLDALSSVVHLSSSKEGRKRTFRRDLA